MAALPYIQLYTADYLADTAHLNTLENGAYLLLMFNYWQRGESFKAKDEQALNKRLASVARLSNEDWSEVSEQLEEFFVVVRHEDYIEWTHDRIERDLEAVREKSIKASNAGKRSAAARSNKLNNDRLTDVEQPLNHTDTDTDTDTDIKKKEIRKEKPKTTVTQSDLIQEGLTEQQANEFLQIRKDKKKSLTVTAWNDIRREAAKAGLSIPEAIDLCNLNSWAGFRSSWLKNQKAAQARASPSKPENRRSDIEEHNLRILQERKERRAANAGA